MKIEDEEGLSCVHYTVVTCLFLPLYFSVVLCMYSLNLNSDRKPDQGLLLSVGIYTYSMDNNESVFLSIEIALLRDPKVSSWHP